MTPIATAELEPITTASALVDELTMPALQALREGAVIRFGDYRLVPDSIVLECEANRTPLPLTGGLVWPIEGDELDGRRVLIYRHAA